MIKIVLLALSGVSILAPCFALGATTFKDGVISSETGVEEKVGSEKSNFDQIVSDIPDWCTELPSSDFALYACGIGNSGSLTMARNRATLDAKRQLADSIDSQISSRMEDFLDSIGIGDNEEIRQQSEIVTKNVTIEAKLTGYKQTKSETQNVGTKFQHYVLIEYPIGQANQALLNKIQQDEILSTQEAADAAMAELEAEIQKKVLTNYLGKEKEKIILL